MKIQSLRFVISAVKPEQFPATDMPEVAFAGRSNVGKSSLINMLVGRKNLVRVSNTPGRTREINFFEVNESFHLVDLPGYGFAKVSKAMRNTWQHMISNYLETRQNLKAVVLLIDVRRTPDDEDLAVLDMFEHFGIPCILAITKADKLPLQQRKKQLFSIASRLGLQPGDCHLTSAEKAWAKEELWGAIECFITEPESSASPSV